jgi:DNA-binding transcriptional regulator LsrR (DeoR family)
MASEIEKQLEKIQTLLMQKIAVDLYTNGCNKQEIGKHLGIAKAKVIKMLKGVKLNQNGKV